MNREIDNEPLFGDGQGRTTEDHETSVLTLVLCTFALGVIFGILECATIFNLLTKWRC